MFRRTSNPEISSQPSEGFPKRNLIMPRPSDSPRRSGPRGQRSSTFEIQDVIEKALPNRVISADSKVNIVRLPEPDGGVRHSEHQTKARVLILKMRDRLAERTPFVLRNGVTRRENRFPIVHNRAVQPDHIVYFCLQRVEQKLVMHLLRKILLPEN